MVGRDLEDRILMNLATSSAYTPHHCTCNDSAQFGLDFRDTKLGLGDVDKYTGFIYFFINGEVNTVVILYSTCHSTSHNYRHAQRSKANAMQCYPTITITDLT